MGRISGTCGDEVAVQTSLAMSRKRTAAVKSTEHALRARIESSDCGRDIIIEGDAAAVTDEAALRGVIDHFRSKMEWPLELRGTKVHGPNAPTAGPPPYTVFRLTPSTIFGLPGMTGMEQFDPGELPRPTRWRFTSSE